MYGYVHVHLHPNGHVCLSACTHQPACFGSTLWSHILPLWSVMPADVRLEVNGGNRLNAETTNTSEHMGWCYFYNPLQQKLMVDKVQAKAEAAKLRRSYKIQFIWGFKALKRKECPVCSSWAVLFFCNTENDCEYYHLSVGPFSVASWLRQKHSVFLRCWAALSLQSCFNVPQYRLYKFLEHSWIDLPLFGTSMFNCPSFRRVWVAKGFHRNIPTLSPFLSLFPPSVPIRSRLYTLWLRQKMVGKKVHHWENLGR